MRWFYLMLCCVIATIVADPDPKKYKPHDDKKSETLTNEEKKFLREVEKKYGVKSEVPVDDKEKNYGIDDIKNVNITQSSEKKLTFPAVIAIEIVNDTDSTGKGKRTIDANLGYGYQTNNGYSYNYFGKSSQDKGKFMIYPYSQEDIASRPNIYNSDNVQSSGNYQKATTNVEIQPSQAFELVPVKDQQTSYEYKKPEIEFKTPSPATFGNEPSTLYTTYNGQEFSGLSGQFPSVMPNYFVNPSQLLTNPQYQSAGLTQDHLKSHESQLGQRIVPVLVLRIPSSSIKNPSAELYANLPQNYPLSSYLNNVNLQQLVNQYFKKNGYSFAPQIMAYQSPSISAEENDPHYGHSYVNPSYSQSDYSGVQYSAVKPALARYPSSYNQQTYVSQSQPQYSQPPQQHYEYQSQQVPQTNVQPQSYYVQSQYEESSSPSPVYTYAQSSIDQRSNVHESHSVVEHKIPEQANQGYSAENYDHTNQQNVALPPSSYYTTPDTASSYEVENDSTKDQPTYDTNSYTSGSLSQTAQVYPSVIHSEQNEESVANSGQEYTYQSQLTDGRSPKGFALSENYPSKEYTIATVFPNSYSAAQNPKQSIQSVSYVTPMPSAKYQSQYRIMVPQTVFKPTSGKVAYVNSNTMHYNQAGRYTQDVEAEEQYTGGSQYLPAVARRPSHPRNYRSHPKRMAKSDNKAAATSKVVKKNETNEKKSS